MGAEPRGFEQCRIDAQYCAAAVPPLSPSRPDPLVAQAIAVAPRRAKQRLPQIIVTKT